MNEKNVSCPSSSYLFALFAFIVGFFARLCDWFFRFVSLLLLVFVVALGLLLIFTLLLALIVALLLIVARVHRLVLIVLLVHQQWIGHVHFRGQKAKEANDGGNDSQSNDYGQPVHHDRVRGTQAFVRSFVCLFEQISFVHVHTLTHTQHTSMK